MSRTQLGGNRIANKTIGNEHIKDSFKLPESYLELNHPTHNHENKSTLDIIRNSNPSLVKLLDLKDVALTILQVSEARKSGLTLKNTIESKVNKEDFELIVKAINEAKGTNETLKGAFEALAIMLDDKINSHKGLISHKELDSMYSEIENARGTFLTVGERLNSIGVGAGTGTGGVGDILALTPWYVTVILEKDKLEIEIPNAFVPGNNSIMVFEETLLLTPGADNDYVEVSNNKIRFNYTLPEGTVIKITGTNAGRLFDWCVRSKTVDGQKDISTIYEYKPGNNDLMIYEDGILLQEGVDYIEPDTRKITMVETLPAECNITICKRRY